jgi:membrane fusion protein (multidrug efflux system)
VTTVKQQDVPIFDEFVGTLDGSVNASIQARVQGYLTSQNYKEGTAVKKGDLLFQIDPRPFEAALAQAKAALAQAEASQRQADLVAARNLEIFKTKAISEQERDNAVQAAAAAKAQVEAQRAAVEQAQLNAATPTHRSALYLNSPVASPA